jgi:DNA-binding transcriptional LysR family regulator
MENIDNAQNALFSITLLNFMHLKELDANLVVVLDALLIDASVTKAAERLGRSPSAISHALANLREVFGDELFVRAGQRLVPTAKALELAPTIHVIVTGIESLLRPTAPFDPHTQDRSFCILSREAAEFTLLQPLRERLRELAPGIGIASAPLDEETWMDKLRTGQAQFAVIEAVRGGEAAELHWSELFEDEWVTLAPASHPLCGTALSSEVMAGAPHVLIAPPPQLRDHLSAHLDRMGLASGEGMRASSLFAGLFLALQANSLVTVPASVAKAVRQHLALKPIGGASKGAHTKTFLVWHRSMDRDECHAWLRRQFEAAAPRIEP